jgi:hypothetical protein
MGFTLLQSLFNAFKAGKMLCKSLFSLHRTGGAVAAGFANHA